MQRITIVQAKAGMVLAEPAQNEQGTVICGAGTLLDDTLLGRMERFSVVRITVEGHPVKKKGDDKSEDELAAMLDARFARHADNELMMGVKAVFREQLHARMTEMAGGDAPLIEGDA